MRRPVLALTAAALAAGGLTAGALVTSASSQSATALTASDHAGIPAPDRALVVASERWQRLTRRPAASLRSLGSAHPGAKSIRVSKTRAALTGRGGRQRFPYPRRTVIVKTASEGGAVTLVAIMRKVSAGSAASSWRYVEYTRSGAGARFSRVAASQALCSGCHVSATSTQGSDSVFYRLSPPTR